MTDRPRELLFATGTIEDAAARGWTSMFVIEVLSAPMPIEGVLKRLEVAGGDAKKIFATAG
jgi:hypothetical protein